MEISIKELAILLEEMASRQSDSLIDLECRDKNGTVQRTTLGEFAFPIENDGICIFPFKLLAHHDDMIAHLKKHERLPREALHIHLRHIGFGEKYMPCNFALIRHKQKVDLCIAQLLDSGHKGLVLGGGYGTGKTTIMRYIAEQLISHSNCRIRPAHIRCIRTSRLYSLVMDASRKSEVSEIEKIRYLIIDDFGRTYEAEYGNNRFEDILAYRYDNNLPTFITTNIDLKADKINNHPVWGRVIDLFRDKDWMFDAFIVGGNSMRD